MSGPLTSKVAVVTGGSSGIGRAVVKKFSKLGASVIFNYHRDKEGGRLLADEIAGAGGTAVAVAADMAQKSEVVDLFDRALAEYGRLDIVVNNAGIAIYRKVEEFTEEEIDRIFAVNVKGVFYCCQQAARHMADNGSIINIGSTVTHVMLPRYSAYAASKAAVEQISRVLAKELGERGIRVNTLAPGPVDTDLFRRGKSEKEIEALASMAALGRIGTVDDIADMVALLVDDGARWISGQTILVNGGFAA